MYLFISSTAPGSPLLALRSTAPRNVIFVSTCPRR